MILFDRLSLKQDTTGAKNLVLKGPSQRLVLVRSMCWLRTWRYSNLESTFIAVEAKRRTAIPRSKESQEPWAPSAALLGIHEMTSSRMVSRFVFLIAVTTTVTSLKNYLDPNLADDSAVFIMGVIPIRTILIHQRWSRRPRPLRNDHQQKLTDAIRERWDEKSDGLDSDDTAFTILNRVKNRAFSSNWTELRYYISRYSSTTNRRSLKSGCDVVGPSASPTIWER